MSIQRMGETTEVRVVLQANEPTFRVEEYNLNMTSETARAQTEISGLKANGWRVTHCNTLTTDGEPLLIVILEKG